MSSNDQNKSIARTNNNIPTQINLDPISTLDLTCLSENEKNALWLEYTNGMMDISKKAQELHVEAAVLKKILDDLSEVTRGVSGDGNAITVTHVQDTGIGRTEVIMGNTPEAESGKLSKSQTGEKNWTPYYIFGGILALVIIAALMK